VTRKRLESFDVLGIDAPSPLCIQFKTNHFNPLVPYDEQGGPEFPVINPDYVGKKPRYIWMGKFNPTVADGMFTLMKYDLKKNKLIQTCFGDSYRGGESTFIPRQNSKAEDDGFLGKLFSAHFNTTCY